MRASHLASALLAGAIIVIPAAASAQNLPQASVTADLNLRTGPGPEYTIITVIPNNTQVWVYGCIEASQWCNVIYGSSRGWAYGPYLSFDLAGTMVAYPELAGRVVVPMVSFEAATGAVLNVTVTAPPPPSAIVPPPLPATVTVPAIIPPAMVTTTTDAGGAPVGTAVGVAGGAVAGAVVAGPIGAIIGAIAGGVAGGVVGTIIDPPDQVRTYIASQTTPHILLSGEVVVGASLPADVTLYAVPDYEYRYAYVNGLYVLVDVQTRQIVYVYR